MNTTNLTSDNPIDSIKHDEFGRQDFVKQLSHNMLEMINRGSIQSSFNIALYGRWGEGKTSLLNCLHSEIDSKLKTKQHTFKYDIIQIKYNPWVCLGQEQMLQEFFQLLLDSIKENGPLKQLLYKYGKRVLDSFKPAITTAASALGTPALGAAVGVGLSIVSEHIEGRGSSQSLWALREDVNRVISESGKHFIIYVDDIDRLDKEEIHLVLRMVKQLAGFKNTIFVLAMDQGEVAKALSDYYPSTDDRLGGDFLEKIVQMPIQIPHIPHSKLTRYIEVNLFENCLELMEEGPDNNSHRTNLADSKPYIIAYILPLVDSPRQIIQLVNNLWCTFPMLHKTNEVDICTFVYLSFLKIVHFKGYEVIRRNKDIITHQNAKITVGDDMFGDAETSNTEVLDRIELKRQEREQLRNSILDGVAEHRIESMNDLVYYTLSSYFSRSHDHHRYSAIDITSVTAFDKYFVYNVPEGIISENLKNTIYKTILHEDKEKCVLLFNDIVSKYTLRQLQEALIDVISYRVESELPYEKKCMLCTAITEMDVFTGTSVADSYEFEYWCEFINQTLLHKFVYHLELSNKEMFEATYVNIFSNAHLLYGTLLLEELVDKKVKQKSITRLVNTLLDILVSRYKEEGENVFFTLPTMASFIVLNYWQNIAPEEYAGFLEKYFYPNSEYAFRVIVYCHGVFHFRKDAFGALFDRTKVSEMMQESIPEIYTDDFSLESIQEFREWCKNNMA